MCENNATETSAHSSPRAGGLTGCIARRVSSAIILRQQAEVWTVPLMVVQQEEFDCAG